jgi:divinyl chlorophyllide a 8-vinyl-reductase
VRGAPTPEQTTRALAGAHVLFADVTDRAAPAQALHGRTFDAVVSCLASRTGAPRDAWRVDHDANVHLFAAAKTGYAQGSGG